MKRTIIYFLLISQIAFTGQLWAQINETEPNNEIASANPLAMNETASGTVTNWDNPDYFQITIPGDGKLKFYTSLAGEADLNSNLNLFLYNLGANAWLPSTLEMGDFGAYASTTSEWCCLEQDTYYVSIYHGYVYPYAVNYTITWEFIPATFANDIEPNSTYQQALTLPYNTPSEGHLNFFDHPQGGGVDHTDFYRIDPPVNGTMQVFIESECQMAGGNFIPCTMLNMNGVGWYTQNSTFGAFQSPVLDTLTWECVGSETMYLKMDYANVYDRGCSYKIWYDMIPHQFANDAEPNNFFATAQLVDPTVPIEGQQYHWWRNYSLESDDIFKFYKPQAGSMKIVASSEIRLTDVTGGNKVQLFDHNFNPVGPELNGPLGTYSTPAVDSISYEFLNADTFYIKTRSDYAYPSCRSYKLELSFGEVPDNVVNLDKAHFSIYPNPNDGIVNILTNELNGQANVMVYNAMGQIMQQTQMTLGKTQELDVRHLHSGIYTIMLQTETHKWVQQFVKQN